MSLFRRRTDSSTSARKRRAIALAAVLALAAGLRARHLDYGLPALNDPDEPLFILTALDMLREGRLNPGWFGHPATLLFYLLAAVIAAVAALGSLTGGWHGTASFVAAVFADPGVMVLPMRGAMALLGVASVWLAWRLGARCAGNGVGLIAALLLAVSPLHVDLSQVIRTDMLATVLMSLALLRALSAARDGSLAAHGWAGVFAGLACATKWPAMLVLVAPASAAIFQARRDRRRLSLLLVAPAAAAATLVIASPYLVLDWPQVLRDLSGEARPVHLGATGGGFWPNLIWYVSHPLARSFGWPGVAAMAFGAVHLCRRDRAAAVVLLPFALVFLVVLAAQALVWERWLVPLLPIAAVLAAIGIAEAARLLPWPDDRGAATAILALSLAGWTLPATLDRQSYRAHDPRQAATAWVRRHVPAGRTLLVEHAAFDLLAYKGRILFPLGADGCVDARTLLAGRPTYRKAQVKRMGRPIVDLGHIDLAKVSSCRADYYVLSNHGRYQAEASAFAAELQVYRTVLANTCSAAIFTHPDPDKSARGVAVEVRRASDRQRSSCSEDSSPRLAPAQPQLSRGER